MARVSPSVYLVLMALAIHASAPDVQDVILDFGPPDYTASRVILGQLLQALTGEAVSLRGSTLAHRCVSRLRAGVTA